MLVMAALQLNNEKNTINSVDESKTNDSNNSRSILAELLKMSADGATQRYKYNKDQLVALSQTAGAKVRPHFLKLEFFNESGVWDPEKWVLGERNDDAGGSGANKGPGTSSDEPKSKRERPADLDRDSLTGKRRSADPKERLKEDQDGIILSPQRRSFGTGCHVTQPLSNSSVSNRRSESPPELRPSERESHREPSRRIGSGRFFSRERDRERDYGYRSVERHDGGGSSGGSSRNDRSDRGNSRGSGLGSNERFRRDENSGRLHRDIPKDYDRRSKDKNFRRIEEEEEPEWFSGGPTSQSETIELRGFDDPQSSSNTDSDDRFKDLKRERRKSWRKSKTPTIEEEEEVSATAPAPEGKQPNGSDEVMKMEEAAVRSEGDGEEDPADQSSAAFDFGDLFKFDTISSIFPATSASPETIENNSLIGSRFGQFFRTEVVSPGGGVAESSDTSRRSSFQDELIAPIISNISEATELVSSPTSGSDTYFAPISPAQLTKRCAGDNGKQLLNVLQATQHRDEIFSNQAGNNTTSFEQVKDINKMENDLKNLVLGRTRGVAISQAESMNAFEKLLSQMSDGRVTPTPRGGNVSAFENENKHVQGSDYSTPHHGQSKLHVMEVLKNAPTEQDILNGFLPTINSTPPTSSRPSIGNQHKPANDFLSALFQSQNESAHQPKTPTTQSSMESLLVAAQANYMASSQARSAQESTQPPVPAIQQQQREILAAILKQQQQQQQHVNPITAPSIPNHGHPPIIQRPLTSPGAPPLSPRSVSPVALATASAHPDHFVHHQQRPNIASPLIFRQDPPAISHAPSPIHPAQIVQSMAPLNPNALQAGHILARVPSPQELRAHTQQIMQNALIKKKLEEQKENFRKRQEMESQITASPIVNKATLGGGGGSGGVVGVLSPSLSIIPTSVMRKMQAGNKDKDQSKITASQPQQPTLHSMTQLDGKLVQSGVVYSSDLEKLQKQSQQAQQQQRPVLGQSYSNGSIVNRGPLVSQSIVASNSAANLQGQMQGRRIVKSNQQTAQQQAQQRALNQQLMNQNKNYLGTPSGIDIAKQMIMQQQQAAAAVVAQRQMNISPMSALAAAAAASRPGLPIRPANFNSPTVNPVRQAVNLQNNNLFMRNLVHNTPSLSQYNQVAAAYQRHNVDPRQLQGKGQTGQSNLHHLLMGSGQQTQPRMVGSGGTNMAVGSRPIQAQSFNNFIKSVNMSGGNGNDGSSSGFDKWFSADVRHKMTNLPPVPTQKAQYVEQLES